MIFDQLPEGVVMICADKIWESEERERLVSFLYTNSLFHIYLKSQKHIYIARVLLFQPEALERYIKRLKVPQRLSQMRRLFTNVVCIQPPKVTVFPSLNNFKNPNYLYIIMSYI